MKTNIKKFDSVKDAGKFAREKSTAGYNVRAMSIRDLYLVVWSARFISI